MRCLCHDMSYLQERFDTSIYLYHKARNFTPSAQTYSNEKPESFRINEQDPGDDKNMGTNTRVSRDF